MNIFSFKNLHNKHIFYLVIIFFFSFLINFYYSKFGVFPIDTFLHYDSAFRILNNEYPIKDYWIVSGFFVDFIQSFFFKTLGVNWFSYIFHASIFNFIVSILSYYFFIDLKIGRIKSLLLTFSFATLAYTISGTPFVDHHAAFFLLISTYLIINALNNPQKKYLWPIIVTLFFFSFFSKQVPAVYVILTQGFIVLYILVVKKYFNIIKIVILSFLIIITFFVLFLLFLEIDLKIFYIQYIDYPRSIGINRFNNIDQSFESLFNQYKFLIFPIIVILIIKINKIKSKKFNFFSSDNLNLIIILSLSLSLIFHQIMTKNQIFIYFLIPILFGLMQSEINKINFKFKKYFSILVILFLAFITIKYHYRYNENRKFHELVNIDFKDSVPAEKVDKNLKGLLWINPFYESAPDDEILILDKAKKEIEKIDHEIMMITHYLFLDSITNKNLNYPSKTFTIDGASVPIKGNKYYYYYKNYLINKIKTKDIKEIYFFKHENISPKIITEYLNKNCYVLKKDDIFYIYKINCLK